MAKVRRVRLRNALPATGIVGGFVVVMAAMFEQPFGVALPLEHPVLAQAGQSGVSAESVVSVANEQRRLESEISARMRAVRSAATRQLEELEAVVTRPKAPQQTVASPALAEEMSAASRPKMQQPTTRPMTASQLHRRRWPNLHHVQGR